MYIRDSIRTRINILDLEQQGRTSGGGFMVHALCAFHDEMDCGVWVVSEGTRMTIKCDNWRKKNRQHAYFCTILCGNGKVFVILRRRNNEKE